jgi:hypothetical protein
MLTALCFPQYRRINRQIKQRDMIRQFVFENGCYDVWRQAGQIDHPADVTVIDVFAVGDFPERFDLAGLQHGQPSAPRANANCSGVALVFQVVGFAVSPLGNTAFLQPLRRLI